MDDISIINQLLEKYVNDKNIFIKDKEGFIIKLKKLIRDGKKNVQIVSDFDMTITRYWKDGQRTPSSHGVIGGNPLLSEEVSFTINS